MKNIITFSLILITSLALAQDVTDLILDSEKVLHEHNGSKIREEILSGNTWKHAAQIKDGMFLYFYDGELVAKGKIKVHDMTEASHFYDLEYFEMNGDIMKLP